MNTRAHYRHPLLEWQDIQGLLRTGYGRYRESRFIRLHLHEETSGQKVKQWLAGLLPDNGAEQDELCIRSAELRPGEDDSLPSLMLNIAFSPRGLQRLGLPASALNSFPLEFVDGMASERGVGVLGDHGDDHPSRWEWGDESNTPHMVLLAYGRTDEAFTKLFDTLKTANLGTLHVLPTQLKSHEHFGFRDGLSNPVLSGSTRSLEGLQRNPEGCLAAGELIFGYGDQRGLLPLSPSVPQSSDPGHVLPQAEAGLVETDPLFQLARRDLGRNGSFLVVRQLEQNVEAFDRFLQSYGEENEGYLAARMMGRWRDGTPLSLVAGTHAPSAPNLSNHFRYQGADQHGERCPLGAHIRRANPRDSLLQDAQKSWEISNRHRILRRGRLYEHEGKKGLLFMCLNVSLARQFEHIQSQWINSTHFGSEYETDPVIGSREIGNGNFTLTGRPQNRRLPSLPRFISVRGGGYFFLPALSALRYLANLP